ncbi:MAG: ATP-binding protein [Bdellovibrionota bacterium]
MKHDLDFQNLFQVLNTPLLILDRDFNIVAANGARFEATGASIEETFGRNVFEVFPDNPDDPKADGVAMLRASLNRVLKNKVADQMAIQKYDIPKPGSTTGEFEVRYWSPINIPLLDSKGNVEHIIHRVDDVTAQMVAQQRESEMAEARNEAESASATKSAFLANMSHEIRTPLGAILGFADLMKDPALTAEERNEYLSTIARNGKALTRLIDDILDLAKVESGKLQIEEVETSFFELLDEVMALFRERAKAKGLYLKVSVADEVPAKIHSDPTRLRQIMVNIVGNALKFTDDGGITIHVQSQAKSDRDLLFSIQVRDTGIGISESQREKLFQPFTQADNTTTRKFGGTGLGLSLSSRLAKALGGDVRLEERGVEEGVGSTFVISFMARTAAEKEAAVISEIAVKNQDQTARVLEGLKVLVVDDSHDNQLLVTRILVKNGAVVETADNGRVGFEKARGADFDLILMDLQMPEMDGYEATKLLLESGFKKPILALTAHAMAEDRAKTSAAGFAYHLTKPLVQNELISALVRFHSGRTDSGDSSSSGGKSHFA